MELKNKLKFKIKSYSFFILFIIIFSIIPKINNQLIIPITRNMNSYYVKIFFDKDKRKSEFVKINMALDFTFIPLSQNYSSQNENSNAKIYLEDEIVEIDNKEFNTKLISTNNFFLEEENNINLNNFKFHYISKNDLDKYEINKGYRLYNNLYFGQIGLSPLYSDNYLNILYILKEQKIINYMSFGIYLDKEKNFLFFGKIEDQKNDIFKDKVNSQSFELNKKLIKKYNKWGTKIDGLVIDKTNNLIKHSRHKYFVYFSLIEDRIFVPDKVMVYLISRVFNIYIKNNICFVTEYNEKKFINCKKEKIMKEKDNFPAIIFVIKKFGFKLTFDDLFINSLKENEIIFIIQKNYYDIDTSIILLGSRFFKKYLIEFDYEKNQIIVNSENVLPVINMDEIEDDFWKDLVRDYNKETEHYDSNYGNEGSNNKKNDKKIDDKNNINEDIKNNNLTKNKNVEKNIVNTNNKNENKKVTLEFEYSFLIKLFWIFLFIIIIFVGICVFLHFRKKIRIEKQKNYFNDPLNENKDST